MKTVLLLKGLGIRWMNLNILVAYAVVQKAKAASTLTNDEYECTRRHDMAS